MNNNPYFIAFLVAVIGGLFAYALLVKRSDEKFKPDNKEEREDNPILNFTTLFGGELYSTLPKSVVEKYKDKKYPRIESLLVRSGNPWGLNAQEFIFFGYISAFFGIFIGWFIWWILSYVSNIPAYVIIPTVAIFSYFIPRIKYSEQAKKRNLEFTIQLPEALDLIIISLSGGRTFEQALHESIPNMKDGVLKEEFKRIDHNIDVGKTLQESLEEFAQRAPNEGIETFVRAIQQGEEQQVPLSETLESRSQASREEFYTLLNKKIASLNDKMMAVLTPTLMAALLIVALAPSAYSLMTSLG